MKNSARLAPTPAAAAFTLVEILVTLGIIFILIGLSIPVAQNALRAGQQVKMANALRQITALSNKASMDGEVRDGGFGFPGENNFAQWCARLVDGKYLTRNELRDLFTVAGVKPTDDSYPPSLSPFNIYAVSDAMDGDAIFACSRNWDAAAPAALDPSAIPFGDNVFIYAQKNGAVKTRGAEDAEKDNLGTEDQAEIPVIDGLPPAK